MKTISTLSLFLSAFLLSYMPANSQTNWPKEAYMRDGNSVKMYQWEPESLSGNSMTAKSAIAIKDKDKADLVFGMAWLDAQVDRRSDQVIVRSARITAIKIPGVDDEATLNAVQAALEDGLSQWMISFASDDIDQQLKLHEEEGSLSQDFNNNPPRVIYRNKPSLLVYIDGSPQLQMNKAWGMEAVINTPFTIVKNNDGAFYLYGQNNWYRATQATGPYSYIADRPNNLEKVENAVEQANRDNAAKEFERGNNKIPENDGNIIPEIVVSTSPAELIQTNGEANFKPISGTSLLYVNNSANDIFLDMKAQTYYVLLSGRWYRSRSLKGDWEYIASDNLPEDFARIPEGSPKDNVLASVAGTKAAEESVLDAQVPQTARVDRNNTSAEVQYDGSPEFENIEGLDLAYATNTASSVIRWRGRYYLVDNGIWFQSYNANGPWVVSTERPYVVDLIPSRYPVYNMKYVYIYDVYPDYVYMGYTPGYLNTYVYGPTVVYGTGWYYNPWYYNYYYPRPCTWGFGIHYVPWYGWSFGFNISFGWFNWWYGNYWYRPYCGGGWWGPYRYCPSYCWYGYNYGRHYYGGYYGNHYTTIINNYYYNSTNIYSNRNGVYYNRDTRRNNYALRTNGGVRGRNGVVNNSNPVRFERDRANNFNNRYSSRVNSLANNGRPARQLPGQFNGNTSNRTRNNGLVNERDRANGFNNGRLNNNNNRVQRQFQPTDRNQAYPGRSQQGRNNGIIQRNQNSRPNSGYTPNRSVPGRELPSYRAPNRNYRNTAPNQGSRPNSGYNPGRERPSYRPPARSSSPQVRSAPAPRSQSRPSMGSRSSGSHSRGGGGRSNSGGSRGSSRRGG